MSNVIIFYVCNIDRLFKILNKNIGYFFFFGYFGKSPVISVLYYINCFPLIFGSAGMFYSMDIIMSKLADI